LFTATHKIRFKVTALVIIYFLRMAFFQTLIASTHIGQIHVSKTSINQHHGKSNLHLPVVHRSHTRESMRCNIILPAIAPFEAFQFGSVSITEPHRIQLLKKYPSPVFKNQRDDAFKRYCLHRTFII
jgi:hypothetical protein